MMSLNLTMNCGRTVGSATETARWRADVAAVKIDALVIEVAEFETIELRQSLVAVGGAFHHHQCEHEQRKSLSIFSI